MATSLWLSRVLPVLLWRTARLSRVVRELR
jgi:hypothetical protein